MNCKNPNFPGSYRIDLFNQEDKIKELHSGIIEFKELVNYIREYLEVKKGYKFVFSGKSQPNSKIIVKNYGETTISSLAKSLKEEISKTQDKFEMCYNFKNGEHSIYLGKK